MFCIRSIPYVSFLILCFSLGLVAIAGATYQDEEFYAYFRDDAPALGINHSQPDPTLLFNLKSAVMRQDMKRRGIADTEIEQKIEVARSELPSGTIIPFPSKGSPKYPVFLVDFPDYPHYPDQSANDVDAKLNGLGDMSKYPYNSLKEYYRRSSCNKFTPVAVVYDWYTTTHNREHYNTTDGRLELVKEVFNHNSNEHNADFSQFDNDHDMYETIDGFTILWTGNNSGWNTFWWPSSGNIGDPGYWISGKRPYRYIWSWYSQPYDGPDAEHTYYPRVEMHEMGHMLGLPDYYDYSDKTFPWNGVGGWDMMDRNTLDHNCFSKWLLDWINPSTLVFTPGSWNINLRPSGNNPDCVWIMPAPFTDFDEYFLVQYRKRGTGNDMDGRLPADSLAVWHLDSTLVSGPTGDGFAYSNSDGHHQLIKLVQADGQEHIDNNDPNAIFDPDDFFTPGNELNLYLSRDFWNDYTGVSVKNIIHPSASIIRADFGIRFPLTATLSWGTTPENLDLKGKARLWGWDNATALPPYSISSSNRGILTETPYLKIFKDAIQGYGPEILAISKFNLHSGVYHIYAVKTSGSGNMKGSSATVTLKRDGTTYKTVKAPSTGSGDFWYICSVDARTGAVTMKNFFTSTEPGTEPSNPPLVMTITPAYGDAGQNAVPVTINGAGFLPGATATLSRTGRPPIAVNVQSVSMDAITGTITLSKNEPPGIWDLIVKNIDLQTNTRQEAYRVREPSSLTLSSKEDGVAGLPFILNGRLSSKQGGLYSRQIYLFRSTDKNIWILDPTHTFTGQDGTFTIIQNEPSRGSYYYRAVFNGDGEVKGSASQDLQVCVRAPTYLSAQITPLYVNPRKTAAVTGTLSRGDTGGTIGDVPVTLMKRLTSGRWSVTRTARTFPNGTYSFPVSENTAGTFHYKVKFGGSKCTYSGSESTVVELNVLAQKIPEPVSRLANRTFLPDQVMWTWRDPAEQDFMAVEVTVDGVFIQSVPRGVHEFLASGLTPASSHTISTRTRNSAGTTSPNWVNNTSRTSNYPVPILHEIIPDNATTGLFELPIMVRGENFFTASSVRIDGNARITEYISSTELKAHFGYGDFFSAGTHQVTIVNPPPGGGVSGILPFLVTQSGNPTPVLNAIDPISTPAGTPGLTLNLTGSNFVSLSKVCWDGTAYTSTYLSPTTLWYDIPAPELILPGTHTVSVFTPEPLGGMSANLTFTVTGPANPVPALENITPQTAYAGDPGFELTVTGANFTTSSVVRWNATDRETSFMSYSTLLATILDSDIVSEGIRNVTVFSPSPGGGVSLPMVFTVLPPAAPSILSISPDYAVTGTTVQSRIIGEHFRNPIDVALVSRVNGARYTGSISSYTPIAIDISFSIPSDAVPGPCNLIVMNSDGSSDSLDSAFSIDADTPTIIWINTPYAYRGDTFSTLIYGTGFVDPMQRVSLEHNHVSIPADSIIFDNPRYLTATFTIPTDAFPGYYDVYVINARGLVGNGSDLIEIRNGEW